LLKSAFDIPTDSDKKFGESTVLQLFFSFQPRIINFNLILASLFDQDFLCRLVSACEFIFKQDVESWSA